MVRNGQLWFLNISVVLFLFFAMGTTPANCNSQKISTALHNYFNQQPQGRAGQERTADIIVDMGGLTGRDGHTKSFANAHPEIHKKVLALQQKAQSTQTSHSDEVTGLAHDIQVQMTNNLTPLHQKLKAMNIQYESLWATGEVAVAKATWKTVESIAAIDEVKSVRPPLVFSRVLPSAPGATEFEKRKENTTWNLNLINARCSGIKCLGDGVRVGFIDGGARVTHQEIRDNWIGMPYGFLDRDIPTNCVPHDVDGHGTHVVGTAVGRYVGVAPKATWLMCLGCGNDCSEVNLKICGQFLFCPWQCGDMSETKVTKNCSQRPYVISNSWGTVDTVWDDFYYSIIELWNAVGIISVFAAGNSGPFCSTSGLPAGYDNTLSIGAIDQNRTMPFFSSVGPQLSKKPLTYNSTATGTCKKDSCSKTPSSKTVCALTKPDMVGPGLFINSSFALSDKSYAILSGTSMATPHVAGTIALMVCANPHVYWDHKLAYKVLTKTANTKKIDMTANPHSTYDVNALDTNLLCNFLLEHNCKSFPNNMFGHGIANACGAVKEAKMLHHY